MELVEEMKAAYSSRLLVTLKRSFAGHQAEVCDTLKALGLKGKINQTVEKQNTASIRGMIAKVKRLVEVETFEMHQHRLAREANQKAPQRPFIVEHGTGAKRVS